MGNKKKHRSSIHSNSDLTQKDDFIDEAPLKNVKRSVSYSGSKGTNPIKCEKSQIWIQSNIKERTCNGLYYFQPDSYIENTLYLNSTSYFNYKIQLPKKQFSIVPDDYSEKNDSDDHSDNDNYDELDSISQIMGNERISRRISSSWQSQSSGFGSIYNKESDFINMSLDTNGLTGQSGLNGQSGQQEGVNYSNSNNNNNSNIKDGESVISNSQGKKQQKKQKKKNGKEKALQMYDERYERTELPSKDDVNEIINHLKEASKKSQEVMLRVIQWIAVKLLALVVLIIQVVLLIIKYIWLVISSGFYHILRLILSAFPFLNRMLLKKHDQRDPFKRSQNNANMRRINEMNYRDSTLSFADYDFNLKGIKKKRFSLALDLDETLVYTEPYKQKIKEQVDLSNNPDIFQVIHPTQQQVQIFTLKKRPQLDIFLLEMSKLFNLIIYSSAQKQYVDAIVDKIDTNQLISKRLYRDHCIKCPGVYIKDLQNAGDIQQTIILDNSPEAVKLDSANSLIIPSFRGQENDQELQMYSKILSFIAENSVKKNTSLFDSLHYFKDNFL